MAVFLSTMVATPSPHSLLAFGDSWAWLGYPQLKAVMQSHGFETTLRAIPGTPAGYWALFKPDALVEAVDKANASHVYLSIGGNDFLEGLPLGINATILHAEMIISTIRILDRLFKARPQVQVYHFGYEILNWAGSAFCRVFGNAELKGPAPLFCPDTGNVTCMTHSQATWLQESFIGALSGHYTKQGISSYHGLNLLGTLQVAGGVAGARVGAPRWDAYSPSQFVRNETDSLGCVHLTPEGYSVLYTEFAKQLLETARHNEPPPGARATSPLMAAEREERELVGASQTEPHACRSNPQRRCLATRPIESLHACARHATRGKCLLFRRQDGCAWHVPTSVCVPAIPCHRRSAATCETELTTGRRAPWDATDNVCFLDAVRRVCRHSDECFGLGKSACEAAACQYEQRCTPHDMRRAPGPNVCKHVCRPMREPSPHSNTSAVTVDQVSSGGHTSGGQELPASGQRPTPKRDADSAMQASGPVVSTTSGSLRGIYTSSTEHDVAAFLGVPFAEAPVDDLRWAPPRGITWDGTLDATASGASCAQSAGYFLYEGCQGYTRGEGGCAGYSEDCLNMNIYTPAAALAQPAHATNQSRQSTTSRGGRAVMVWIHGGCFVSGSASGYDGAPLAATHDVVVAVVQYRLGAFGWLGGEALRTRDPSGSTGNWGLLDNIAALRWLHDNAAVFGGDPSRVTIFGESSGAGSISQLLGAKPAWPYFQQAILESGTASFWTYMMIETAQQSYARVLSRAGCETSAHKLPCLLAAASSGVTNAVASVPCRDGCTWAPTVDGVLVQGQPLALARAGQLRPNTPIISGFNLNDGATFVTGYPLSTRSMNRKSLEQYFSARFGEERVDELQKLFGVPEAFPGSPGLSRYFYAAQRCETDFSYACTALWLTAAAPKKSVWAYQFSEPTGGDGLSLHGAEIDYVFGTLTKPSAAQAKVSKSMMTYWANFAKAGDPNGGTRIQGQLLEWPAYDEKSGALINLTSSPSIASVPPDSFPGCSFFDAKWDFYSGCLPP